MCFQCIIVLSDNIVSGLVLKSVFLLFQFQCPSCKAGFDKRAHHRAHVWACIWCEKCSKHVDKRHLLICGKRPRKGARLFCRMCHKLRAKDGFRKHMKTIHGVEGWVRRENPDVLSEVGGKNMFSVTCNL